MALTVLSNKIVQGKKLFGSLQGFFLSLLIYFCLENEIKCNDFFPLFYITECN